MPDWIADSLSRLTAHVREDGGWPYYASGDSALEPTALAIAALQAHDAAPELRRGGVHFILSLQRPDGAMRPQPTQSLPTALGAQAAVVLAALDEAGAPPDARAGAPPDARAGARAMSPSDARPAAPSESRSAAQRVADYLLSFAPQTTERTDDISNDSTLRGFGWTPGTFSWVEPTAYALLLLARLGMQNHPRAVEARRVLLDRALPSGGWNYGNSIVFGHELEPDDMPTALALLALAGDRESAAVTRGVSRLHSRLAEIGSPLSLAWCAMALRARGIEDPAASPQRFEELLSHSERAGSSAWHRAAALLAVAPLARNPFVLP